MGQSESSSSSGQDVTEPNPIGNLQQTLSRHATDIKQAATIPYQQFLDSIKELNEITNSFGDIGGKTLVFQIRKGTDTSVWWRGTVRIKCHKVFSHNGTIESTRVLNLKQYIRLYKEITMQAAMTSLPADQSQNTFSASIILNQMESSEVLDKDKEECCICMDRQAAVILPCSHIYCEQCIDQWSVDHKTCPICRQRVAGADDTWVLTEKPDKQQMAYETTGYLMGLADRTGAAANTGNGGSSGDGGQ